MKRLRGAIVGFGNVITEAHLPGFAEAKGFDVVAVADAAAEARAAVKTHLPEARVYETLTALLEGEGKLEFVDIATPPRFHAEAAVEALRRGIHVLCEKPLAVSRSEMNDVRTAASRAHRSVFTVHNWKYAPLFRRLHGVIVAGTIGEPSAIEWTVLRPNPPGGSPAAESWRLDRQAAGGGILTDHGWHAFYLMLYLTRQTPQSVSAVTRHDRGLEVEDNADCTIGFPSCTARIHLSWTAPERRSFGEIRGPLGTITIDDSSLTVSVEDREPQVTRFAPPLSANSYHPEWFSPLLEDFRSEVLHADQRGRNLSEAVWCADLLQAAYDSRGEVVRFESPEAEAEPAAGPAAEDLTSSEPPREPDTEG